jgi:hypothetical protein
LSLFYAMGARDSLSKDLLTISPCCSMSKLSVTFKGLPLQTIQIKPGETGIGRDPSNEVHIDSLAIADFHAEIRSTPEGDFIRALQLGFPVIINRRPVTEHLLADGDHIVLGKHSLFYAETETPQVVEDVQDRRLPPLFRPFESSFQVMNGKQIGMVIPLKATVTQIGKEATGMVIVTRTNNGHVIEAGSENVRVTINGQPLQNREATLVDGDIVRINSSLLQYFQK